MTRPRPADARQARHNYLVAMDGALALMSLLLIVQMWLLTASLEAFLSGNHRAALPGVIVSAILFIGCACLYVFVNNIERRAKNDPDVDI